MPDRALRDVLEPGDHAQRRRLAAARRADEHHELAVVDREIERLERTRAVPVDLARALERHARHALAFPTRARSSVRNDSPPPRRWASPALRRLAERELRRPGLDAERVGAGERQRLRPAVGLPGDQPAEQRRVELEPEGEAEARVLDGDVPVPRPVEVDVVVAPGLRPGHVAQVGGAARPRSRGVGPRRSLAGLEPRGVLPHLGDRHDRVHGGVEPAAGLEERRPDARSGGPR